MTEQPLHPDHELVELALGELGEPHRTPLIQHLGSCPQCRGDYDDILAAVDATLPAAPQIAPPVGFEQRRRPVHLGAGRPAGCCWRRQPWCWQPSRAALPR
jgi:anti-sigma factor RsiW